MAEWLLFFIERAIWLQFKANVEQSVASNEHTSGRGSYRNSNISTQALSTSQHEVGMEKLLLQKDAKNQPLFLPT